MADQRNGGALFTNTRKQKPNHPDFRGEISLDSALLRQLVDAVKAGKEAKIALACWNKRSKGGTDYLSVAAQLHVPYEKGSVTGDKGSKQAPPQDEFNDDDEIPF